MTRVEISSFSEPYIISVIVIGKHISFDFVISKVYPAPLFKAKNFIHPKLKVFSGTIKNATVIL